MKGRHVDARDFAVCGHCRFPGFFSEFNKWVIFPLFSLVKIKQSEKMIKMQNKTIF
jgi:hypothetical protein